MSLRTDSTTGPPAATVQPTISTTTGVGAGAIDTGSSEPVLVHTGLQVNQPPPQWDRRFGRESIQPSSQPAAPKATNSPRRSTASPAASASLEALKLRATRAPGPAGEYLAQLLRRAEGQKKTAVLMDALVVLGNRDLSLDSRQQFAAALADKLGDGDTGAGARQLAGLVVSDVQARELVLSGSPDEDLAKPGPAMPVVWAVEAALGSLDDSLRSEFLAVLDEYNGQSFDWQTGLDSYSQIDTTLGTRSDFARCGPQAALSHLIIQGPDATSAAIGRFADIVARARDLVKSTGLGEQDPYAAAEALTVRYLHAYLDTTDATPSDMGIDALFEAARERVPIESDMPGRMIEVLMERGLLKTGLDPLGDAALLSLVNGKLPPAELADTLATALELSKKVSSGATLDDMNRLADMLFQTLTPGQDEREELAPDVHENRFGAALERFANVSLLRVMLDGPVSPAGGIISTGNIEELAVELADAPAGSTAVMSAVHTTRLHSQHGAEQFDLETRHAVALQVIGQADGIRRVQIYDASRAVHKTVPLLTLGPDGALLDNLVDDEARAYLDGFQHSPKTGPGTFMNSVLLAPRSPGRG